MQLARAHLDAAAAGQGSSRCCDLDHLDAHLDTAGQGSPSCCAWVLQAKQDSAELEAQSKALKQNIADLESKEADIIAARDASLVLIGNLVHDSVPVSDDEV